MFVISASLFAMQSSKPGSNVSWPADVIHTQLGNLGLHLDLSVSHELQWIPQQPPMHAALHNTKAPKSGIRVLSNATPARIKVLLKPELPKAHLQLLREPALQHKALVLMFASARIEV